MKLFNVDLGYPLHDFYVVAEDPTAAYKKIRKDLDDRDYGFTKDRELRTITLVAETGEYPQCEKRLML